MYYKKLIKYAVSGVVALFLLMMAASNDFRSSMHLCFVALTGDAVDRIELQVDQGSLALQRFDNEYARAQQKLVQLKALSRDYQLDIRRSQARAKDFRAEGKEELAGSNDDHVTFLTQRLTECDASIERQSAELIELKSEREKARETVRILRERIALMKAERDALDKEGSKETLQRAEQNVENLKKSCNELTSRIEVINMTQD